MPVQDYLNKVLGRSHDASDEVPPYPEWGLSNGWAAYLSREYGSFWHAGPAVTRLAAPPALPTLPPRKSFMLGHRDQSYPRCVTLVFIFCFTKRKALMLSKPCPHGTRNPSCPRGLKRTSRLSLQPPLVRLLQSCSHGRAGW